MYRPAADTQDIAAYVVRRQPLFALTFITIDGKPSGNRMLASFKVGRLPKCLMKRLVVSAWLLTT